MTVQKRGGDLVPVHGGLAEPVDRVVSLKERSKLVAEAAKLPAMRLNKADLSTVHRIADGTLSPLEGPMGAEAWHRVLDESVVVQGGRRYAWGIPLSLPVTDAEAGNARARRRGGAARRGGRNSSASSTRSRSSPGTSRSTCGPSTAPSASTIRAVTWSQDDERTQLVGGAPARAAAAAEPELDDLLAAHDARLDSRSQVGAGAGLPDAQPAAPRARVRAGRGRRASHARGLLHRRRAEPAGRRAQGRRRARRDAHALLPRAPRPPSCSARATRTRRCGRRSATT